jgi:hypothetical protein
VTEPVQWVFTVNVTATGNSVTKVSGCDGCPDASAVSSAQITGNGLVQFAAAETGTLRYAGLAYGGAGTAPGDINYAIRLQGGVAEVRENNAYRTEIGFATGDTFAVVVENNIVRYTKNGAPFYTSQTQATAGLRFHAVLFNTNGSISGIGLGGTATASAAPSTSTPTSTPTPTNKPRWAKPRPAGSTPTKR